VFDPETIADTATYDQPHGVSVGVERVFVNGVLAYRGNKNGNAAKVLARAGRMLTRPARAVA
jgi:N-acyl-D-amino-acid deacylase